MCAPRASELVVLTALVVVAAVGLVRVGRFRCDVDACSHRRKWN
jgi:hypothetical protein